ncbi:MAG: JAB domain-containing protein [Polyangiaceae bacterium]|nr:JAB domain-containing protein [Polyangiaceae bacterium]
MKQASDEDLVAALVSERGGAASRKRAEALLSEAGGLAGLVRIIDTTPMINGIGYNAARRLAAAVEIGLRCGDPCHEQVPIVRTADDVVSVLGIRIKHLQHEQVWMVALDGSNSLMSKCLIGQGGQHGCALLARDVLRQAVHVGAHCFILAHNHPAGDPQPSSEDVHFTEKLSTAALCVGIPMLDHIIVTRKGYCSMLTLGLMRTETS